MNNIDEMSKEEVIKHLNKTIEYNKKLYKMELENVHRLYREYLDKNMNLEQKFNKDFMLNFSQEEKELNLRTWFAFDVKLKNIEKRREKRKENVIKLVSFLKYKFNPYRIENEKKIKKALEAIRPLTEEERIKINLSLKNEAIRREKLNKKTILITKKRKKTMINNYSLKLRMNTL